ncbi:MAG: metal ABC transporter permease [Gammaproteobacteria bacterium]
MPEFLENLLILGPSLSLGFLLSTLAGPLGCLMVWRNLSYFGDCLAHTALLGLGMALLLSISTTWGLLLICVLVGIATFLIAEQKLISNDTVLNIISQILFSTGLISIYHNPNIKFDMQAILFGDILSITWQDVQIYAFITVALGLGLKLIWQKMLQIILSEDLAQIAQTRIQIYKFSFQILLAVFYAVSIKLIGGLLSTALLVIPTVAAKLISKHPRQMALFSSLICFFSILGGLVFSLYYDYPSGPCVVLASACFLLILFAKIRIFPNNLI